MLSGFSSGVKIRMYNYGHEHQVIDSSYRKLYVSAKQSMGTNVSIGTAASKFFQ